MEENKSKCLKVNTKARGTIPQKVSDLQNDVPYISAKDLEKWAIDKGDSLLKLLPKDEDGKFIDGNYHLEAEVVEGIPSYHWVGGPVSTSPIYHGVVEEEITKLTITEQIIKSLIPDGTTKSDKEYGFTTDNQKVVFAYPASFGDLSNIYIKNLEIFPLIGTFDKVSLTVDGVGYYVYLAQLANSDTYTYVFKF